MLYAGEGGGGVSNKCCLLTIFINLCPAEPGYILSLHSVDPDQHCLSLSMDICIKFLDQVIRLAEN